VREQIEARLAELRKEHEAGRRMLAELEARQMELQETLLRIGGAAQVLEELLAGAGGDEQGPAAVGDGAAGDRAAGDGAANGRVPAGAVTGRT